ncbi:MAG: restriction endonuclease subunit S [Gemmatimonadales bacterium]|nr:restriction endonuclease subunit S [Gemmatimonadales bacterium]
MSELPAGWRMVPLGEMGAWAGGGTPSKAVESYWTGGTIPWISPKDMKREILHSAEDYITPAAVSESSTRVVPHPAVLVVTRSGILSRTLPVAVTAVDAAINQDIKSLVPIEGVSSRYVAAAMRAFERDILTKCSKHGTTVASIDQERLLRFEIPLAPPADQDAVVEVLDTHLSRLDAASDTLERAQRNLKRYRASVLKAAVEGRLVPTEASLASAEGRSYEPASVLLERILAERRERWKASGKRGTYKEPVAPDTTGLPELPEGWCWGTVGQIADVSGGITKNAKRDRLLRRVPYLRVANVYADELRLEEVSEIGVTDAEFDRVALDTGDLLVVEGNGSPDHIGRAAIWDGSIAPCVHQNHLIKARFQPGPMNRWVLSWLRSSSGRKSIERVSSSTSGLYTLSISKIAGLVLPIPPSAEQQRISLEVSRLLTVAVAVEGALLADLSRLSVLRSRVLRAAFRGELV